MFSVDQIQLSFIDLIMFYDILLFNSDNFVKAFGKGIWRYSLNMTGVLLLTLAIRILVGRMSLIR